MKVTAEMLRKAGGWPDGTIRPRITQDSFWRDARNRYPILAAARAMDEAEKGTDNEQ